MLTSVPQTLITATLTPTALIQMGPSNVLANQVLQATEPQFVKVSKNPARFSCYLDLILCHFQILRLFCFSPDVDECTSGTHNCYSNAVCSNTNGAFMCACNSGFTDNGETCASKQRHYTFLCISDFDFCHQSKYTSVIQFF